MDGCSRRRFLGQVAAATGISVWRHMPIASAAEVGPAIQNARRTLRVGHTQSVRTLREAAVMARDGDEVLVDPGEYRGDVAVWSQRGLVIRAAGAGATLVAAGASAEDKGSFVFRGAQALVENFAFVGAQARDGNGAGIRLDTGSRLTVSKCRFEDNENGILTSNDPSSELNVVNSSFSNNGAGDGQTHNLYVGAIAKLTVTGCYFARARVGHLLKSRARESLVAYSRLTGEDGTSSYELEFPSGGRAVVIGCVIQQGPKSDNSTIVSFGAEGLRWDQNELLLGFSTIINDRRGGGTFLKVPAVPARVEVLDNLLMGPGDTDVRSPKAMIRNMLAKSSDFADAARFDYRLHRSSRLVGAAGMVGALEAGRVRPEREYVHVASSVALERFSPITALSPGAFQRLAD